MLIVWHSAIAYHKTKKDNEKKRNRIWLIGLIAVLLTACSQEEPVLSRPHKDGKQEPITDFTGVQPSDLAQVISDAEVPSNVWKEVYGMIEERIALGDDEFINFSAAVADTTDFGTGQKYRMKTRTQAGCCPMFREYLIQYLASAMRENPVTVCSANSISDPEEYMRLLENSNLEIYWPYSEDWNPDKDITITYWNAPTELQKEAGENDLVAEAYPVTTVNLGTEVDDADFISGNTIVIRNQSEFYSTATCLLRPVFTDQGSEDGGGYQSWASPYDSDNYDPKLKYGENADDYIYEWKLTKMMVSHHFDHKGAGGSELEFSIVRPNDAGDGAFYTQYQVKFTRKEIDKHMIKTFEHNFNTSWTPDQTENGLILMERDWSPLTDPLEFSLSYKGVSLTVKIPLGDFNDDVHQCHYNRDFIITHRKEKHCLYGDINPLNNNNVYVKMPLIKVRKGIL